MVTEKVADAGADLGWLDKKVHLWILFAGEGEFAYDWQAIMLKFKAEIQCIPAGQR